MVEIIAEFHYWDYGEYSQEAMDSRPEINIEELERIGRKFNVEVKASRTSASYFAPMRFGLQLPRYGKIIIQVVGQSVEDVKACVGRIFLLYGRPDDVPSAFFGEKRAGRMIIEELLREFRGGKE